MVYAVDTKVPVSKTRIEIENLILKRKASNFAFFSESKGAMIAFELSERRIVFRLPLPNQKNEQDIRSRWRGLLLCIKAKFESIDRGTETFEEAFLSHFMMPDGRSVAQHVGPRLASALKDNLPLLPPPEDKSRD